jgi:hypothetical protein
MKEHIADIVRPEPDSVPVPDLDYALSLIDGLAMQGARHAHGFSYDWARQDVKDWKR